MSHSISDLPDASLLRRVAAGTYDLFLLFAIGFAYSAIAMAIVHILGAEQEHLTLIEEGENLTLIADESYQPALQGPLFQLGLGIALLAFFVGFWIKKGATLGMQTWRMKLIDLNGDRPNLGTCVARALLGTLSFAFFGVGYLWSLVDKKNRTLHDILSKTRVVVYPKT